MNKKEMMNNFEKHRPIYHFSSKKGWINDPNGLIYHGGYFHLFYQHYPEGVVHGPMHWGHARSKQLIDWEELPIALYPDEKGTIFSGCIVYDQENTSGLGKETAPLVAVFTQNQEKNGLTRQYQSLAYSTDGGMTFEKYAGNPVLDLGLSDFRDPKVFWYPEEKRWIMLAAVLDNIFIFSSKNLREWKKESIYYTGDLEKNEIWECPDLCLFKTREGIQKWVLIVSQNTLDYKKTGVRYFVGKFDGKKFYEENSEEVLWLDFGRDNYAAATFAGIEGRIVQVGWMNCWAYAQKLPEQGFRGSMTIPRELYLLQTPMGLRLGQMPVEEVKEYLNVYRLSEGTLEMDILLGAFLIDIHNGKGKICLSNKKERFMIDIDFDKQYIVVDRSKCGENLGKEFTETKNRNFHISRQRQILLIIDITSVEIFTAGGEVAGSFQYFSKYPFQTIKVQGGTL